ncbi:E3 SUMO-protein ligase MMS21-like [Silene latifolia]|uniref:E3 SUMO-protein ligase MMS21-like n=1 Tax=Silene latifolia TaxID=37657 RepID=UPI003D784C31
MASTSGNRASEVPTKIKNAVNTLSSDNQPILADIRKSIYAMQEIAVEMEKLNRNQQVKELEDAVLELLYANEECSSFSSVMQSVREKYQPGPQLTNFKKMLDAEKSKFKGQSAAILQKDPFLRRFREAVWNVHHGGQPMPGEEQEEIMMTTTQFGLLNTVCPITGKAVTDLSEPVRSIDCKHVYEKEAIMLYLRQVTKTNNCPVAGCPKALRAARVVCDTLLPVEIEEMRSQNKQTEAPGAFEDFTNFSDSDSS